MTDLAKALAFARECLKFEVPERFYNEEEDRTFIMGENDDDVFEYQDTVDVHARLDQFLGKRYLIQINRGTSTLFKWTVIVGLQDKSVRGAHLGEARADSDDLFDAIFDACVMAVRMDK